MMQEKREPSKMVRWLALGRRRGDSAPTPEPVAMSGPELGISLQRGVDRARVVLSGELDMSNAHLFAEQLNEAEAGAPEVIEIDLRGLSFIDSSGLRELFAANRRARARNRRIVLIKDHGPIDRVLNLARVEDVIDVVDRTAN